MCGEGNSRVANKRALLSLLGFTTIAGQKRKPNNLF